MDTSIQKSPLDVSTKHWYFLDFMKGLLLILVFVGHLIPGGKTVTLSRYIIYAFHMPLFIGISGFLFNIEKQELSTKAFFKRYSKRLLLPWFIAFLAYYFVVNGILKPNLSLQSFWYMLYFQYYHLWYILGILFYMYFACVLWKRLKDKKHKWTIMYSIAAVLAVVTIFAGMWVTKQFKHEHYIIWEIIKSFIHDVKPYNFPMFLLGMHLRYAYEHGELPKAKPLLPICAALFVGMYAVHIYVFYHYSDTAYNIDYMLLSLPLIVIVIYVTLLVKMPRCKPIEFIGQYSLPIYLYHTFCKIIAKSVFVKGSVGYFLLGTGCFLVLILLVYLLRNVRFINTYIFGSTNSFLQNKN